MIFLLQQGQYEVFALLIIALILSLSAHEYGHALVAKHQGDDTAEKLGRLTLNPIAHIDIFGLLMVVIVGFGYAKPVPINPANFKSKASDFWVAAAGPFMNLVVAVVCWNTLLFLAKTGNLNPGLETFLLILAQINLLLMVFNLLPLGPLDGHYMLPHLLPEGLANRYRILNAKYGTILLLGLVGASLYGLPVFSVLRNIADSILQLVSFV